MIIEQLLIMFSPTALVTPWFSVIQGEVSISGNELMFEKSKLFRPFGGSTARLSFQNHNPH